MAITGLVVLVIALFVVAPIVSGLALSILWGWFVVPVFSLPSLSIPAAIGLTLTLQVLIRIDYDEKRYANAEIGEVIGVIASKAFFAPLMVLAFGWLVKQFI